MVDLPETLSAETDGPQELARHIQTLKEDVIPSIESGKSMLISIFPLEIQQQALEIHRQWLAELESMDPHGVTAIELDAIQARYEAQLDRLIHPAPEQE